MKKFLKEKLKNKFVIFVLLVILLILWKEWYKAMTLLWKDVNSYVTLVEWEWNINDFKLKLNDKIKLNIKDEISTIWEDSIAVIKWWDWSITRLWWDSKVLIEQLDVEKDLSKINLIFTLKEWKSSSNVVSFLWEESYFKQNFQDIEASVRWTVFDVNLSNNYVYVKNHEVSLKKWNKKTIVKENSAFNISLFSFIEIKKFLKEINDNAWDELNKVLDKKYLDNLKVEVREKFSKENINKVLEEAVWDNADDLIALEKNLKKITWEEKEKIYNSLLKEYQKLNFVSPEDSELFESKNKIKKLLITTAWEEDKENLVKYSFYDLKDALELKNLDWMKESFNILSENMDVVKDLDIDLKTDLFDNLSSWMKDFFEQNSNLLKDIFWDKIPELDFSNFNLNIDVDNIKNKADKLRDEAINKIWDLFK